MHWILEAVMDHYKYTSILNHF